MPDILIEDSLDGNDDQSSILHRDHIETITSQRVNDPTETEEIYGITPLSKTSSNQGKMLEQQRNKIYDYYPNTATMTVEDI